MRYAIAISLIVAVVLAGGCGRSAGSDPNCVKPTVAVLKFDNRAPFPMGWKIGGGMSEVLVDRLLKTGRYHVVERADIAGVMREIQFQPVSYTHLTLPTN